MTRHFPRLSSSAITPAELLVQAVRCWRDARDSGRPVQPCLFNILVRHECGMLAPVLDSMMRFCEGALGRGLRIGDRNRLSDDERLLVGLLDGSRAWHVTRGRTDGMEIAFDRTIRSVRIMIAGVMPERIEAI